MAAYVPTRYGKTSIRYIVGGIVLVDNPFCRVSYYLQIPISSVTKLVKEMKPGEIFWCKEGPVGFSYLIAVSSFEAVVVRFVQAIGLNIQRIFRMKNNLGGE